MVDKNSDKPRPRRNKKKTTANNIEDVPMQIPIELQQMMQEALRGIVETKVRSTADELNAVGGMLEEFLQSYVLIAYTMEGNPIHIMYAPTQQDADALSTAVTRFFMQYNDRGI